MIYTLSKKNKSLKGTIDLTASKSESNRVLIIRALCNEPFSVHNLALAEDTQSLQSILKIFPASHHSSLITHHSFDVGPAGSTFRFLTSFFAIQEGAEIILTGSERMKQRPIGLLVNSLRQLGADIEYVGEEGFPPIKIKGKKINLSTVSINGSVSSQYITSLLLIAPVLKNGLKLTLEGTIASRSYLEMTIKIMKYFGADLEWKNNIIEVRPKPYSPKDFVVEADWSSASYWYAMAAFSQDLDFNIKGLKRESLQGDSVVADIFESFGVGTEFNNDGIRLFKTNNYQKEFQFDFKSCPDIAQTVAVVCAALKIPAKLEGLETLKIKETDRLKALINELAKMGAEAEQMASGILEIKAFTEIKFSEPFETYEDHRMAMAFAPLALKYENVKINEPEVVKKSYPAFWKDMKNTGFEIQEG